MSARCLPGVMMFCGFAAALSAQQRPEDLLVDFRHKLMETVGRLPKYMCTQTIERYRYQALRRPRTSCDRPADKDAKGKLRLITSDRLRLDVAVTATSEIYSWVGENHFDDHGLFDLIRDGAISSGTFAGFLTAIFGRDSATFSYDGDTPEGGRQLVEFGFQVPLEKSNYTFGNRDHRALTAYDGTFLIDPKTLDLVRLVVRTSQLPAESGVCEADSTLDYGRVQLNGSDFLLPSEARLDIFHLDGGKNENRTRYSGCHEFHAESTVSFEPPPTVPPPAISKADDPSALELPAGLPFRMAFTQAIDTAAAAGGDLAKGILTSPIQDRGRVLAPRGAAVTGRIIRIEHAWSSRPSVTLTLRLETIDAGAGPRAFRATGDSGSSRFPASSGTLRRRIELGDLNSLEERNQGVSVFANANEKYVIRFGTETKWLTLGP